MEKRGESFSKQASKQAIASLRFFTLFSTVGSLRPVLKLFDKNSRCLHRTGNACFCGDGGFLRA